MKRSIALLGCLILIGVLHSSVNAQTAPIWRNGLVTPNGDAGMLYMGEKGGFAKSAGLDLQIVSLRGDPLVLKALLAGQLESYIGGPASPLVAASKGADIKIVGCNWNKQSYVLWGNKSVSTISDLRGKSIGISTPGSAPDIFIRAALKASGVDPSEVKFVAAGLPPDWLKSMAADVIQGSAPPDEYEIRGKALGLHVLTNSDLATPLSMQRCYFARGVTVREHPDLITKFLVAEMAAYKFSLSHRDETIKLTRAILNAPADAPEAIANYDSVVSRNVIDQSFEPPMEKLRWLRDTLAANDLLDGKWDPRSMLELAPLAEARKSFIASDEKLAHGAAAALKEAGVD